MHEGYKNTEYRCIAIIISLQLENGNQGHAQLADLIQHLPDWAQAAMCSLLYYSWLAGTKLPSNYTLGIPLLIW